MGRAMVMVERKGGGGEDGVGGVRGRDGDRQRVRREGRDGVLSRSVEYRSEK